MAKMQVKLNGKKVVINTDRPKVASALVALIEACAERQFPIGMILDHANGVEYQLVRILQPNGELRAYLINTESGKARNSRKVVYVEEPTGGEFGNGYVTDLPCERDKFIDPDGDGEYLDI